MYLDGTGHCAWVGKYGCSCIADRSNVTRTISKRNSGRTQETLSEDPDRVPDVTGRDHDKRGERLQVRVIAVENAITGSLASAVSGGAIDNAVGVKCGGAQ